MLSKKCVDGVWIHHKRGFLCADTSREDSDDGEDDDDELNDVG